MGDKCKLMRAKAPREETSVGDKCGRQVGDKCKIMRPILQHAIERVGRPGGSQKGVGRKKTSVIRPETPRVKDKCGRQVEDKSKLMLPKEPYGNIHSRAYGLHVLRFWM